MSGGLFFANDPDFRKGLREPFPPEVVGKLPKPTAASNPKGKCGVCGGWHGLPAIHLDFVSHAHVTDRLNHVAPDWTIDVRPEVVNGHIVAIVGTMTVGGKTLPEVGDVDRQSTYGDEYKRGISDFIRRGAMRFGVAIEQWMKEDAEDFKTPVPSPAPPSSTKSGATKGGGAGQRSGAGGRSGSPVAGDSINGAGEQPAPEQRSAADTPGDPGSPGRGPTDPGPNPAGHHSETAPAPDGASAAADVDLPLAASEHRSGAESRREPSVAEGAGRSTRPQQPAPEQTSAGADALGGGGGGVAADSEPLPPVEVTYDTAQQMERLRHKFGGVLLKRAREVLGGTIFVEADLERLPGEDLARLLDAPKKVSA